MAVCCLSVRRVELENQERLVQLQNDIATNNETRAQILMEYEEESMRKLMAVEKDQVSLLQAVR